jgi:hypothetical protein
MITYSSDLPIQHLPPPALVQALNELLPPELDLLIDPVLDDNIQIILYCPEEAIKIPEEEDREDSEGDKGYIDRVSNKSVANQR